MKVKIESEVEHGNNTYKAGVIFTVTNVFTAGVTFTVPIRSNFTESKPQQNPWFTFWVYTGFTRVNPELTQSKPKVNPEWTQRLNPDLMYTPKTNATCVFRIYKGPELQAVIW